MKTITYIKSLILCFALLLILACTQQADFYLLNKQELNNKNQNSTQTEILQGDNLNNYKGQWLIFNFWAEWCAPCREEIPELNRFFQNSSRLNVSIIGISYDPLENKEVNKIIKKWDIQYPVLATNPIPILPFKLPKQLPSNYILNPNGEIVAKLSGTQTFESISKLLKRLKKEHNQSQ